MDPIHHYRVPNVKIDELHRAGDEARLIERARTCCTAARRRFRDRLAQAGTGVARFAERAGPRTLPSGSRAAVDGPDLCASG